MYTIRFANKTFLYFSLISKYFKNPIILARNCIQILIGNINFAMSKSIEKSINFAPFAFISSECHNFYLTFSIFDLLLLELLGLQLSFQTVYMPKHLLQE